MTPIVMALAYGTARTEQMTNQTRACHLAVFFSLAATALTGMLATPAYADNGRDNWNQGWNEKQARKHYKQQEHWRETHYDRYYHQPDVYYRPPPVIYEPPYYQQPAPSFNFYVPLR